MKMRKMVVGLACACAAVSAVALSLDGEWTLRHFPQPDFDAVRELKDVPADAQTLKATVPGDAFLELEKAGVVPPLFTGTNVWAMRCWENRQWLYSRTFRVPAFDAKTRRARLRFGGLDTLADVFLNGEKIGSPANMQVEHVFDVTAKLRQDAENEIAVLFRSRKFSRTTGLIWWNVQDGWPQLSDAVVDYFGGKKRAYYAIRNVQHDQLVMVRDDHKVVAVNDTLKPVEGRAKVVDRESGKVLLETSYSVPKNAAVQIGSVAWSGQGLLDITYEQGGEKHTNWFLYGEPPFDFSKVMSWLCDAGVVVSCKCLNFPELPLKGNCDEDKFKLYMSDSGLLVRTAKGLVPVEVTGKGGRSKSQRTLIGSEHYPDITWGIKLHAGNVDFGNDILTLPYFTSFLVRRYLRSLV